MNLILISYTIVDYHAYYRTDMPDNRFRGPEEPMGPAAAMVTRSVNYEFNGDANYHAQDPWI